VLHHIEDYVPPTMRKTGMYGSAGHSLKKTDPMAIMQSGMMMVMPQAMVQPMVPSSKSRSLTRKSIKFLDAFEVNFNSYPDYTEKLNHFSLKKVFFLS